MDARAFFVGCYSVAVRMVPGIISGTATYRLLWQLLGQDDLLVRLLNQG